jgi:membrane protein implicated in regulation of membrane protease activity
MPASLENVASVVSIVATVGSLVLAMLLWRMRGEFATKSEQAAMTTAIGAIGTRVSVMEAERTHAATREDVSKVTAEILELRGDIKGHEAKIDAIDQRLEDMVNRLVTQTNRIEGYLLDQAGRKRT